MTQDSISLGALDPQALVDARLTLHAAAQPIAAAAYALCPARPDHSHGNLLWSRAHHGLLSRAFPSGRRGLLRVTMLRLDVLDASENSLGGMKLTGFGLDHALTHFGQILAHIGESLPDSGLQLPGYELPPALTPNAFVFGAPPVDALHELARWMRAGDTALSRLAETELHGAEVRGWPHHFDFAALDTLDADAPPDRARSIGAGLSLGDASYPEPYFYVTPWPYPEASRLPALEAGGEWRTEGFTAAVLLGTRIAREASAAAQHDLVDKFLRSAVRACATTLDR